MISSLIPGETDTNFFDRASMENTPVGQQGRPGESRPGWLSGAAERGTQEVSGIMNKVQDLFADLLPAEVVAQMHRRLSQAK